MTVEKKILSLTKKKEKVLRVLPSDRMVPGNQGWLNFLLNQASDSEEVVTPLMLDGTYLSRNFATLGPTFWQPPWEADINCQKVDREPAAGVLRLTIPKDR